MLSAQVRALACRVADSLEKQAFIFLVNIYIYLCRLFYLYVGGDVADVVSKLYDAEEAEVWNVFIAHKTRTEKSVNSKRE